MSWGHSCRRPGSKTSGWLALESLEKQAFGCGHPWPKRADAYANKLRAEKHCADFSSLELGSSKWLRKVWVSIKFLSAKFGSPPPPKRAQNEEKLHKSIENWHFFCGGGGGETQFYGQNDFMDSWAFLSDGLRLYCFKQFVDSQYMREIIDPNAFKTRRKCTCHESALAATRQTRTWSCPDFQSFWEGYSANIPGPFVRTSRVKNFRPALETLENKHLGADIHDPNARTPMQTNFGQKNIGLSKEEKIPQPLLLDKNWNQKLKPLLPKLKPLFPRKPAEKGKLNPKTKTMVLVFAMGRVKGIFAPPNGLTFPSLEIDFQRITDLFSRVLFSFLPPLLATPPPLLLDTFLPLEKCSVTAQRRAWRGAV